MDLTTLLTFIGALVMLILVHEFGHYFAAKLMNIEVEEFGIGFPPRAVKLFTWDGTIFSLNWIPLGGFVRPKGENNPDVPGGLAAANPWARIFVLAAGPAANIITAILLYALIFARAGAPNDAITLIASVNENTPAAEAGLMPEDRLISVAGVPIDSPEALQGAIGDNLGVEIEIVVARGEEVLSVQVTPRADPPEGQGPVGFSYLHPRISIPASRSLLMGGQMAYFQVQELVLLPSRVLGGQVAPEDARLVGFTTMGRMFSIARETEAESGMPPGTNTLALIAYISVSLGILNLFPIPAVDGGRILFTLPEILIRRRVPPRIENAVNAVSFLLLLLLLIYVNIQDIVNPVILDP